MASLKAEAVALAWYDDGVFRDKTHPKAVSRDNGERGFKLKLHEKNPDAPLSPFYFMLRTEDNPDNPGTLSAEVVADSVSALLHDLIDEHRLPFQCICGLPNAGEPFARDLLTLVRHQGRSVSLLRLHKAQQDGQRRLVGPPRGNFNPGQKVLVIDDLITAADTKLEGIAVLEEAELRVRDVLVLVDRQQGGAEQLQERGYNLHALWKLEDLLKLYVRRSRISAGLEGEILAYAKLA